MPHSTVKTVPLHVKFQETKDTYEHEVLNDNDDLEDCFEEQSKAPSHREDNDTNTSPIAVPTFVDVRTSLSRITFGWSDTVILSARSLGRTLKNVPKLKSC